ncbi:MAG: DUF4129 domain-containing protein [Acidimicrobiia bacterium]|nr:DUF4129 domain-containing protein [Acidimicrobiia bacterium]
MVLVVVLVVAVLAWWLVTRRRSAGPDEDGGAEAALAPTDADGLERAADEAEAAGDLEGAIRLRFRAGLLRLDDAGAVAFRPSLTTGQVARALRLGAFETVGSTHDTVVYGRRPATGDDVERTRRGWEQVLGHVGAAPGRGDGA